MTKPRRRLLPRIAGCSLAAAIAIVPTAVLTPDAAIEPVVNYAPAAGLVLIAAAGGAAFIYRRSGRTPARHVRQVALGPGQRARALPSTQPARALPAAPSRPVNSRPVHPLPAGQPRNQLGHRKAPSAIPAAPGGAR